MARALLYHEERAEQFGSGAIPIKGSIFLAV
jgi:hypothetical protein